LRKTKESGRKTWQSASRSELLIKLMTIEVRNLSHQRDTATFYRHIPIRVTSCACAVATSYEI